MGASHGTGYRHKQRPTGRTVLESGINFYFSLKHASRVYNRKRECPTPVWYCITTLYGGHNLCNDIHKLEGSQFPYNCNGVALSSLCVYKATVTSRCV